MDSPFQSMLYTNTVPSNVEYQRIQGLLAGSREKAASVTEEIVRLQNLLEPLLRKRDALNKFIEAHMSLVSPARRLPPDIVRAIFIASLPSTRNCVMSGQDSPLLLCQICSAWRQLALSTPQLWASLHIVIPRRSRIDDLTEVVTVWLSRSGVVPLSLSVTTSKVCDPADCDPTPIFSSLAAFSRRWKHISINLPTSNDFNSLTSLSIHDVPMLRTALVGITSSLQPDFSGSALKLLSTPSLRGISIVGEARFAEHNFKSTQLVHLKLVSKTFEGLWPMGNLSLTNALGVLRQCPALETCSLQLSGSRGDDWNLGPAVLPSLWSLKLRNTTFDCPTTHFIQHLILPTLRSLHYSAPYRSEDTISFSGVAHGLTHLSIDIPELMHGLEELEIIGDPHTSDSEPDPTFFSTYFRFGARSEQPLCPNLRRLQLRDIAATSDEDLLALIQSRAGTSSDHPHLEHFRATVDRRRQIDIIPRLQPIIDAAGLKVSLVYPLDPPPPIKASPWEGVEYGNNGEWYDDSNPWKL
ncbi:hypothetical protein B0H11DRAFT_2370044 [Mycena galericulata]|nr:hypothetical protein B0H11DRAFT_2370044 [Mycena galericulata]